MNLQKARQELVEIGKRLYAKGFVAANDGNISVRLDKDRFLLTPTGVSKGFMKAEEMVVLYFDDRKTPAKSQASSEAAMHRQLYLSRADVQSVCHAHPPYATAFAAAGILLPGNVLSEAAAALGKVVLLDYAAPGSEQLAELLRRNLNRSVAFLLANHGALTLGATPMQAYFRMETLEHSARIIHLAGGLGQIRTLSAEQVKALQPAKFPFKEQLTKATPQRITLDPALKKAAVKEPVSSDLVNEITKEILKQLKKNK